MATEFGKSVRRVQSIRSTQVNQLADLQRHQSACIDAKSAIGSIPSQQLGEYNAKLQQALAHSMEELFFIEQTMNRLQYLFIKRGLSPQQMPSMATYAHFHGMQMQKNARAAHQRTSTTVDTTRSRPALTAHSSHTQLPSQLHLGDGNIHSLWGGEDAHMHDSGAAHTWGRVGKGKDHRSTDMDNDKVIDKEKSLLVKKDEKGKPKKGRVSFDSRSVLATASMLPLPAEGSFSLSYVGFTGQLGHVEASQPPIGHLLDTASLQQGRFWEVAHAAEAHLPIGCQVAAFVRPQDEDEDEDAEANWLLARIVDVQYGTHGRIQYLVMDEDVSAPGSACCQYLAACRATGQAPQSVATNLAQVKTYLLPPSHVLPLPTYAEFPPARRYEFPPGSLVLALYPEEACTVFYRARVVKSAKKRKGTYLVRFDEEDEDRLVPAKFVVPYRAGAAHGNDDMSDGEHADAWK